MNVLGIFVLIALSALIQCQNEETFVTPRKKFPAEFDKDLMWV